MSTRTAAVGANPSVVGSKVTFAPAASDGVGIKELSGGVDYANGGGGDYACGW